jgi:hypothetical protein
MPVIDESVLEDTVKKLAEKRVSIRTQLNEITQVERALGSIQKRVVNQTRDPKTAEMIKEYGLPIDAGTRKEIQEGRRNEIYLSAMEAAKKILGSG